MERAQDYLNMNGKQFVKELRKSVKILNKIKKREARHRKKMVKKYGEETVKACEEIMENQIRYSHISTHPEPMPIPKSFSTDYMSRMTYNQCFISGNQSAVIYVNDVFEETSNPTGGENHQ